MKSFKTIIHFFAASSLVILFTGCEIENPVKELTNAKSAISTAKKYKAETYAKEELSASETALYDAHTLVKDGKNKDAESKALASKAKAEEALAKSLPLLAFATIDQAKSQLADAKNYDSAEFAREETTLADELIASAEKSYADKKYIPAYEKGLEAITAAELAIKKTFGQLDPLEARLSELEAQRDNLKEQKAEEYAGTEMSALDNYLASAKTALDDRKLKDAIAAINSASEKIDAIKAAGIAATVKQKIAKAEEGIKNLTASPDSHMVSAEISAADAKVKEANDLFKNGKISDASAKADEALAMIDSISISLEKIAAEKKAQPVEPVKTEPQTQQEKTEPQKEPVIEKVVEYIVQWRKKNTDCLWRIADKVYKNAKLWPLIYVANRTQIKDPDLIYPGQKLIIPPIPVRTEKEKTPVEGSASPEADKSKDEQTKPEESATSEKPAEPQKPEEGAKPAGN